MLNPHEKQITAKELQENYDRLAFPIERVLKDLQWSEEELMDALEVARQQLVTPGDIWKLCDYLEDMLTQSGKEMQPETRAQSLVQLS
ncbi:MAG: DUF2316 family protein [Aerococcus sp.]|nr:DUF2316 family protein [Aerococcus sp.]